MGSKKRQQKQQTIEHGQLPLPPPLLLLREFQWRTKGISALLSPKFEILSCSSEFASIVNIASTDLIGQSYPDLFASPLKERKTEILVSACTENSIRSFPDQIGEHKCISTITPLYSGKDELLGIELRLEKRNETSSSSIDYTAWSSVLRLKKAQLFTESVCKLSLESGVLAAFIGRLQYANHAVITPVAFARKGILQDEKEFSLSGQPSAKAIINGSYVCTQQFLSQFPDDAIGKGLHADSYYGTVIELSDGTPWGVIALYMNTQSINALLNEFIIPVLAKRIALEVENESYRADSRIKQQEQDISGMQPNKIEDIFSAMHAGYVICDAAAKDENGRFDLRYIATNSIYEKLAGLSNEQLQGKPIRKIHPEIEELMSTYCEAIMKTGTPVSHEIFSYRDNKTFNVWLYSPAKDRIAAIFFDTGDADLEKTNFLGHFTFQEESIQAAAIGSYKVDILNNSWRSSRVFDEILGISPTYPKTLESWLNLLHLSEKDIPIPLSEKATDVRRVPFEKEYYIIRHVDGQVRYISDSGIQIHNENGDLVFIIGSIVDITQRRNSEKALQESEQRFSAFMENIPAVISIKDTSGKILFANKRFMRLFGCSAWSGKTMYDLVENEIADQMALDDMKVLKKGFIQKIEKMNLTNGDPILLDTSIFSIPTAATDYYIGRISIDVTSKIKAESKLLESGRKLSTLLHNLPGMVYRCKDTNTWDMEFISQGCAELTGYTPDELMNSYAIKYHDLIHEDDRLKTVQAIRTALSHKHPYTLIYRIIDKTGDIKWVWEKGAGTFTESGKLEYLEGFINDMTEKKLIEIALQESEERYRQFVENDISGDYITTPGGKILYCNSTFLKIFSFASFDEARNCNVAKLFANKTDRMVFLEKLKREGKVERNEVVMKNQKGEELILLENASGEFDRHGILTKIHGYLIDITEMKHYEAELQINQDRLNTLYNLNLQQFESEQAITQYVLTEIVSSTKSGFGYLHFLDHSKTRFATLHWYIKGKSNPHFIVNKDYSISDAGVWCTVEKAHIPSILQGTNALADLRGIPIQITEIDNLITLGIYDDENLVAIAGLGNKLTGYTEVDLRQLDLFMNESWKIVKRRRVEEELQKLSMIVEQSPVSVVLTDIDGNISYVNQQFLDITGYSLTEIIGQNSRILKTGYTSAEEYQKLWSTIKSGNVWTGELYNKKKSGDFFWESVLISPIKNNRGEMIGFAAVKEDITQRKQMMYELIKAKERAEEINKVKDTFFANMSHELRTPMIGILGFSQVILDATQDPEIRSMLKTIQNSASRLTETLNLILEVSKLESQTKELHYTHVEVLPILQQIKEQITPELSRKNLAWEVNNMGTDNQLETDESMFTLILTQLISNAVKYTMAGKIQITIRTDEQFISLSVSDTGIGIPKDKQHIVWQEFRQVSEGYSRNYEGTGLGLTVVKKFVELLKGRISLESEIDKGTTVTVTLPIWKEKSAPVYKPVKLARSTSPQLIQRNESGLPAILHIDDDPNMISVVAKYLEENFELDSVETGEEALDLVKQKQYDAILMDINLGPGKDGMEVTQLIRQFRDYSEVPIIALTAFAMTGDKEAFLSIGCSHYLAKPFRKQVLVNLLQDVIRQKISK
jgi:PAS domain S-box-containing protein